MSQIERVRLLHTNDVHSNLDLWPATAAVIQAELARAAADGCPALYVDAGDFMEMSDRVCYGTRGEVATLLGAAGCSAFVPGNNELWRNRLDRTSELAAGAPFPWLCCNLRHTSGQMIRGFRDWALLDAGPVKVGVVGVTAYNPAAAGPMGLVYLNRNDAVRRAAAAARQAGARVVVLLSHVGLRADREIASLGLGIDLIIGGHSHEAMAMPEVVAGVHIVQAGMSGEHVGAVTLNLTDRTSEGRLIKVNPAFSDPATCALVDTIKQQGEAALDEVVVTLPAPLPHDPLGDSALGRTVAEALRRHAGAEVGLATGIVAVRGLAAGPVTRRDLLEAMPSLFAPGLIEGTGAALLTLLEEAHCPEICARPAMAAGQRTDGAPIGRVYAAGLTYSYFPHGRNGRRVVDVKVNGQPLEFHRVYRIGAPSFMAFPRSGYPGFAGFREIRTFAPDLVREVLEGAFRMRWFLTD
ncbi:MAG TPA: 5'-nucleotidase C-terminal domain-containing protein [Symbiobacteriaceae bacterium]|nr:5'-nucleotidase C-terminal domain-containing protein [Symbiobacteriaceae bacterium]